LRLAFVIMSLRLTGRDIATVILSKSKWDSYVWLKRFLISLLWMPCGWYVWCMNSVFRLLLDVLWEQVLFNFAAVCCNIGIMSLSWWPRSVRQMMNFLRISVNPSWLFCIQYLLILPAISPLRQVGGWADLGGRYKYRFRDFWKVLVKIFELMSSTVRK